MCKAFYTFCWSEVKADRSHSRHTPRRSEAEPRLGLSLLFVLGFGTVFVILGASATTLGQLLLQYRCETNVVGGAIVIVFGLFMLGLFQLSWLQRDVRFRLDIPGGRPLGAYVRGVAFAEVPCHCE